MATGLNWKEWKGKKAHIILKNNYEYNCIINSVTDVGNGLIFIEIIDKFNDKKIFDSKEIKFIEEKMNVINKRVKNDRNTETTTKRKF